MRNDVSKDLRQRHLRITDPSPWVARFAPLVRPGGPVLDLAAGGGRHARYFLVRGHPVTAVDRDGEPLAPLVEEPDARVMIADLEDGPPVFAAGGPLAGQRFAGVVVINYLHRVLFSDLVAALEPGGVFIYETFARGNEEFARPRNPDHLLKSAELLDAVAGKLQVVAYEHGRVEQTDIPGVKQRICAINDLGASTREDGEPPAHPILPR